MIKPKQTLIFLFLLFFTSLKAQNINTLLIEKYWSAYDNFAVIDFQENGKAIIEYAYCSYCRENKDTINWFVDDNLLRLGTDSLFIQKFSKHEIFTFQYGHEFNFKALDKSKKSKLKKENILEFLTATNPMNISVNSSKSGNSTAKDILFSKNGKMWFGMPKFRGQWAVKSFYGHLFLIYINRYAINKDFPLLRLDRLKKGKLVGKSIPSTSKGIPFVVEITRKN